MLHLAVLVQLKARKSHTHFYFYLLQVYLLKPKSLAFEYFEKLINFLEQYAF